MYELIEGPDAAALFGGSLVMLGAWLPWLTLFAGLQRYGGLIGIYGRVLFVGGALVVVATMAARLRRRTWIRQATALLGLALLAFNGWLLRGLLATLHHGVSAMLVPRAGPGLFVSCLGSVLVASSPLIVLVRKGKPRQQPA
jgi:hypothetical protein